MYYRYGGSGRIMSHSKPAVSTWRHSIRPDFLQNCFQQEQLIDTSSWIYHCGFTFEYSSSSYGKRSCITVIASTNRDNKRVLLKMNWSLRYYERAKETLCHPSLTHPKGNGRSGEFFFAQSRRLSLLSSPPPQEPDLLHVLYNSSELARDLLLKHGKVLQDRRPLGRRQRQLANISTS